MANDRPGAGGYDRSLDTDHPNPSRRAGGTVAHPWQPWTPTVHAFLRHLEACGVPGVPRVVGDGRDEHGDELLTWLDGEVLTETGWPDPEAALADVGGRLRRVHDAAASFVPPAGARWMPWTLHADGPGTVVGHGNVAPWHVVFAAGRPAGLIGWEYAGPVDPVDEVAVTGWYCAQLFDDDVADRIGLPDAAGRARWFRALLDGYGLPRRDRHDLVDRIVRFAVRDNGWYARTRGFTPESRDVEGLWTLAWQSRAALWTLEHRELITATALAER